MKLTKTMRDRHLFYVNVNTDYYSFKEMEELTNYGIIESHDHCDQISPENYKDETWDLFTWKIKSIDIKEGIEPEYYTFTFTAVATLIDEIALATGVKEVYICVD